ncbi:alcohol dehydrogenase AdhP [Amycolatopsis ultiminotia]|uniref:alcohol dehydrogenase n=1 Tax=Amycolatopsis ultiminotia TaxID=543629 RepID=A0ABP6XIX7_9PSEU
MRAAILRAFGEPLDVAEVDRPEPRAGELLVRVRAVGICATDLKLAAGATAPRPELPHIPGHEVAGEEVDPRTLEPTGRRVACHILAACGQCRECLRGYPVFCDGAVRMGLDRNGGMAEYATVRADLAIPFSAGLDFADAAAAMDSVTTPWHGLHGVGKVQPGEFSLVVGVGGLGINAVQIAADAGARVAAVDIDESRRAAAQAAGAELVSAPADVEDIRDWSGGGVDLSVELSGTRAGFDVAATAVRRGGTVVCCGYFPGVEYGLDSARLVLDNIRVLGSRNASVTESAAALATVEQRRVVPRIARRADLSEVNDMLALLKAGRISGRVVLDPSQGAA